MTKPTLLRIGFNHDPIKQIHPFFAKSHWEEISVIIEPKHPEKLLSLSQFQNTSLQGICAYHALEYLHTYEVPIALKEYNRIIEPGGFLFIGTFDLQTVGQSLAEGKLEGLSLISKKGRMNPMACLYGPSSQDSKHRYFMHRTGFIAQRLADKLQEAGFNGVRIQRDGIYLYAIAYKLLPNQKPFRQIQEPDINLMMKNRDELDQKPIVPVNYP